MKVGVLALQGDFAEHCQSLSQLGVEAIEVRLPEQIEDLDGLIIPGGESTTIGKLMDAYGFIEPLRAFAQTRGIWGTCAGAILMAQDVGHEQVLLKIMDIRIARNAFGRQIDSFETDLAAPFPNRRSRLTTQCLSARRSSKPLMAKRKCCSACQTGGLWQPGKESFWLPLSTQS
jgi:pyridoxal 5'-phosphate synthase glutaminase subunit Pdx2